MWTGDSQRPEHVLNPAGSHWIRAEKQKNIPGHWSNTSSPWNPNVPGVTAELFAEAIAVANTLRQAQGKGPVTSFQGRDFWEILKDLVDSVLEQQIPLASTDCQLRPCPDREKVRERVKGAE